MTLGNAVFERRLNNSTIRGTKCCCQSEWRKYRTHMLKPKAIEDVDERLNVGGQLLQTIMFADDLTELLTQRMMDKLNESVERHGMKVNGKKTYVMKTDGP